MLIKKIKKSKNRLAESVFLLSILFLLFFIPKCFSDEPELIELETQNWNGQVVLDGQYVVPAQNYLTIERGTEVIFEENSSISVEGGMINAIGTEKEPIIFRSFNNEPGKYFISVDETGGIYFKNVDISGGGVPPVSDPGGGILTFLVKKVLADTPPKGALMSFSASIFYVDNCSIHDNVVGILASSVDESDYFKVNRSKFYNNEIYSVLGGDSSVLPDFRYNWWESENHQGIIDRSFAKIEQDFRDPLIIIPGIMGSTEKNGEWKLDLILRTYDDLVESLIEDGYEEHKDLFLFPYQWRDSNVGNALLLKEKVETIKTITASNKVDIVAHSMGGLLAREYLESDYYQDDIDQLITLGTPHRGSPESYPRYEAGVFSINSIDPIGHIGELIFTHEAHKKGFDDLYDYIHNRPISSLQELLPDYNYLWDKEAGIYKEYPNDYPRNEFIENLNDSQRVSRLAGIEFNNIVGSRGADSTITGYRVKESDNEYWEHGYPDDFDSILGDRGIVYGGGDETVPSESAGFPNQYATYSIEIDSKHTDLPTDSQQDVIELLTGERPGNKIDDTLIENLLFVSVFSPVDIQIVLSDGKKIGTDFETGEEVNEVEGAYYSGSQTDTEFITIPNHQEDQYEIISKGTGDGDFRIEVTFIKNIQEGEIESNTGEIQGIAAEDQIENFEVVVSEDSVVIVEKQEEPADDDDDQGGDGDGGGDQGGDDDGDDQGDGDDGDGDQGDGDGSDNDDNDNDGDNDGDDNGDEGDDEDDNDDKKKKKWQKKFVWVNNFKKKVRRFREKRIERREKIKNWAQKKRQKIRSWFSRR